MNALFAEAELTPEFVPLDAGTLPERVELARRMDPEAVVVAGGDGTIACAAQVLAGSGTPLGILPFGTMNLLAKDLGIPTDAPDRAMKIIAAGLVREIDVAEVNGRVFLYGSVLGMPARLGRYREAQRARNSGVRLWMRVGLALLRLLNRYLPPRFVMEADGRRSVVRAPAITITANAVDEPDGRAFGRGRLDRGELVVYLIERLKLTDLARLAVTWWRGTWRQQPFVSEIKASAVILRTRRRTVRVMNDGENILMEPPLRYRIRPRALRVFVAPAGQAEQ